MLHNIKQRTGEDVAMEVLDVLRELRQMHDGLRMVFTGSIGLHNVISGLKVSGYANAPLNDMQTINVEPLDSEHARELALRLFEGERLSFENAPHASEAVAAAVDRVPFYIHFVVDRLKFAGSPIPTTRVAQVVTESLTDSQDGWHMMHYRERIDTYYTNPAQKTLVLAALDALAFEEYLSFEALFERLKLRSKLGDDEVERTRDTLILLQRDHYIVLDEDGTYHFRFPLVRRWWKLHRG